MFINLNTPGPSVIPHKYTKVPSGNKEVLCLDALKKD